MNYISQIVTVAAVVIGALTTYLVTARIDRDRYQREVSAQWIERKLDNYSRYASDVKNLTIVVRQITALHGLHKAAPGINEDEAMALLDDAEVRRATSYEAVKLLGDANTLLATRELNDTVHKLEWIARGKLEANSREFEESYQRYKKAAEAFYQSVRQELGVPGNLLPRGAWKPPSLSAGNSGAVRATDETTTRGS